jgi:hypothetical protein
MRKIAEEARPITGRGVGYKLLAAGLINGMNEMNLVYRALKIAREERAIPWDWIIAGNWNSSAPRIIPGTAPTASSTGAICGRRSPTSSRFGPRRAPFAASCGRS